MSNVFASSACTGAICACVRWKCDDMPAGQNIADSHLIFHPFDKQILPNIFIFASLVHSLAHARTTLEATFEHDSGAF